MEQLAPFYGDEVQAACEDIWQRIPAPTLSEEEVAGDNDGALLHPDWYMRVAGARDVREYYQRGWHPPLAQDAKRPLMDSGYKYVCYGWSGWTQSYAVVIDETQGLRALIEKKAKWSDPGRGVIEIRELPGQVYYEEEAETGERVYYVPRQIPTRTTDYGLDVQGVNSRFLYFIRAEPHRGGYALMPRLSVQKPLPVKPWPHTRQAERARQPQPAPSLTPQEVKTRAWELLKSILSEKEQQLLTAADFLIAYSPSRDDRVYLIPRSNAYVKVYEGGSLVIELCVDFPDKKMPVDDKVAMRKLMLEASKESEDEFWQKAFKYNPPGR